MSVWARGRRKIARKSPETRQPSPILQPWGHCLQGRDKKQPDGNEGPTLQSGFSFEFLEGGSAHSVALSNGTFCVPITHQQKTSPQISVAATMLAVTTAAVAAAARFRGRSDHGIQCQCFIDASARVSPAWLRHQCRQLLIILLGL